jgi:hypothetical protein
VGSPLHLKACHCHPHTVLLAWLWHQLPAQQCTPSDPFASGEPLASWVGQKVRAPPSFVGSSQSVCRRWCAIRWPRRQPMTLMMRGCWRSTSMRQCSDTLLVWPMRRKLWSDFTGADDRECSLRSGCRFTANTRCLQQMRLLGSKYQCIVSA